jgi:uncharacterized protein YbjT (DUF2867 family)
MPTTILVTGSTGTVGSKVVGALADMPNVSVRAGVRSAAKAQVMRRGNVVPIDFDYGKAETVRAATEGADAVFLLTPFVPNQVELAERLVDAAKTTGVKHLVKLSALGADQEPGIQLGRWHRAAEKYVEASGIAYTFLRPNNFMDNFLQYYPPDKEGNIYLPWGRGACSFIDARDIAAVAAVVLTTPGHAGKSYELTGPEAVTIAGAAAAIGEAIGRTIRYVDVSETAAREAMFNMKLPAWMIDGMMELHAIDKAGYAAGVTDVVPQLLGRSARRFSEFARDHAAAWKA